MNLPQNNKVKELRKLHGVTQKQMADALDLKQGTYSYKEINNVFNLDELKTMAKVMGIPLEELTGDLSVKELSLEESLSRLMENQLLTEAMVRVCLNVLAELWAAHRKVPVTTVLAELAKAVNSGTKDSFDEL